MRIHSKEFWEKIKAEYFLNYETYLCLSSVEFSQVWERDSGREEIKKLARRFLRYNRWRFKYWSVRIGIDVIFLGKKRKIRSEFIDWCIKHSK